MENCVFCKLVNQEIEAYTVFEDEFITCILDIDPINEGHLLIIPKQHVLDLDELDTTLARHIMVISQRMTQIIKELYQPDGYSIMQNGGHFNDIGHYHLHIFPRFKQDGFSWVFNEVNRGKPLDRVCQDIKHKMNKTEID